MLKLLGISLITGVPIGVIAQEVTDGGGGLPPWATWGVLGIVIAGIITRQIAPGWALTDLKTENTALRAENGRLVEQVLQGQRDVLPALAASTAAQTKTAEAIVSMASELQKRGTFGGTSQ